MAVYNRTHILELFQSGLSYHKIGQSLNVSGITIKKVLTKTYPDIFPQQLACTDSTTQEVITETPEQNTLAEPQYLPFNGPSKHGQKIHKRLKKQKNAKKLPAHAIDNSSALEVYNAFVSGKTLSSLMQPFGMTYEQIRRYKKQGKVLATDNLPKPPDLG